MVNPHVEGVAERYAQEVLGRRPTDESKQFKLDEKNRVKHIKGAKRDFRALLVLLAPLVEKALTDFPKKDKQSLQRRGRLFNKLAKVAPAMTAYLDQWIGTEAQHPKAYSWRSAIVYQARDVLLYGKTQRAAMVEVEKQAYKGFEAITMAGAQGPLRDAVPSSLREFLPKNIVVEVDDDGTIQHVTDRFENEHLTLGKKIAKMRDLVAQYNAIAKRVKRDLKSRDEIIKLSALITAIIMETGIRPGKIGNGVIKTVGGEQVTIETFGAITLGPGHVRFIRANFAELEFIGKKGGTNTASLSDAAIIKVLNAYVAKALNSGTPYVFVTANGQQFSYSDLQRYFRENFGDVSPTDFRKLKATETVLGALRNEQADLYTRIRGFAKTAKADLQERIVAEIVVTFEKAIAHAQEALSHESAATTLRAYINPEIVLRFLSTGRVDDSLESAILAGESKLAFDPMVFVKASGGKMAAGPQAIHWTFTGLRTATALGELLLDLRGDLEDAGIRRQAAASVRVAERYMQSAGTADDITRWLPTFQSAYNDMLKAVTDGQSRGIDGTNIVVRQWANTPWVRLMDKGHTIANGILSTRSIPPRMNKGLEMAYRLFANSRKMPKDVYKWWAKNQKRLMLIITAAHKWPEKVEGGDELFTVGSFRVHNTVGATGPELKSLKDAIAKVEKLAKTNPAPGMSRTVYGDIHVVARITKAHHAAWYFPGDDSIYLRRSRKTGMDEVQAMVHELGHRYLHKFASSSAKAEWDRYHREVEGKPADVKIELPKPGESLPNFKVPGVRGDPVVSRDDGVYLWFDVTVRGKAKSYRVERYKAYKAMKGMAEVAANFPTRYSATSPDEHFCDAMSYLAMRKLPAEHAEAFNRIWN